MLTDWDERDPAPTVEFVATIRADVPVWAIENIIGSLLVACPQDGILTLEFDGTKTADGTGS